MTIEETFLSRMIHQYRNGPNILALKDIVCDSMQDTVNVCEFLLSHNSIDTAEEEQLEKMGELIGVPRPLLQEDPDNLFTLCRLGEANDPDNSTGFQEIYEIGGEGGGQLILGGYLTSIKGLNSITHPGETLPDVDYRRLIRQKAASYRKTMTRETLFNYLIAFGSRCVIDDDTAQQVIIDPIRYYDLNEWEKWYVVTRGFKPAGISVAFTENIRHGDSI